MAFVAIVLALVTAMLWLPNVVDLVALFGAAMQWRTRNGRRDAEDNDRDGKLPRLLFLVPAHNEELLIDGCVRSLTAMDYPKDRLRLVVIADNSSDATARIARSLGVECLERSDVDKRGKPHALAWAIDQTSVADFDACVVLDADTTVAPNFARGLAALGPLAQIAAQSNIGTMNEWDNWLTRLAGVLARCRYEVSYRLRDSAHINCPLTGNGMCIGRDLLVSEGWQAFSLTENWELYARYTAAGVKIRYAHNARIFTQQVRSMRQGQVQRARWLAGRMSVLRAWARRIMLSDVTPLRDKFATIAELASLSPVLHLSAATIVFAVAVRLPEPAAKWIAWAAASSILSQLIATLLVMVRHPSPLPTLSAFLWLPVYAIWRTSVAAVTLILPGSGEWRKTERHPA